MSVRVQGNLILIMRALLALDYACGFDCKVRGFWLCVRKLLDYVFETVFSLRVRTVNNVTGTACRGSTNYGQAHQKGGNCFHFAVQLPFFGL